jgi:hypothetical protein
MTKIRLALCRSSGVDVAHVEVDREGRIIVISSEPIVVTDQEREVWGWDRI